MATLRVLVGYTLSNGRKAANTFGVLSDDPIATVALQTHVHWDAEIMPVLADDVVHTVTRVATIDGTGFAEQTGTVDGGDTTDPMTPNVAYLVRKSLVGRSRGGRWFLPGCVEGQIDGKGQVSASKVTAINTALDDFKSAMDTSGHTLVVLDDTAPIPNSFVVSGLSVDSIVSTQRRRLR